MEKLLSFNIQGINAIFSQLSFNQNIITWICTCQFDRQIFLHQNFEKHFTLKTDDFYRDMFLWREILLPEDRDSTVERLYQTERFKKFDNYLFYRSVNNDNSVLNLCDNQFTLHDTSGNLVAYAGIVEVLPTEIWTTKRNEYLESQSHQNNQMRQDLSLILSKEFGLETRKKEETPKQKTESYIANLKNNLINLSLREAETVKLLLQGLKTKHIARNMQISPRTVDTHINNICQKAMVHSRMELITQLLNSEQIQCWIFEKE